MHEGWKKRPYFFILPINQNHKWNRILSKKKERDKEREIVGDKERERRLEEEREIGNIDLQRKGKHPSWLVISLNPNALINLNSQYVSVEFQIFT